MGCVLAPTVMIRALPILSRAFSVYAAQNDLGLFRVGYDGCRPAYTSSP